MHKNLVKKVEMMLDCTAGNFDEIIETSHGWSDAVDFHLKKFKKADISIYQPPTKDTLEDHIHRRLGHIVISPVDEYNVRALKETYVYSQEDSTIDEISVNQNTASSEYFVNLLINEAIESGQRYLNRDQKIDTTGIIAANTGSQVFTLYGKRGSGKTFYLNHLFAKFENELDKNKILWIRLNLLNDFGDNVAIREWIYAQVSKIVYRYYDPNSSFCRKRNNPELQVSPSKILMNYANGREDSELRLFLKQKIDSLEQIFYHPQWTEPVVKNMVPEILGRTLFDYLLFEKGFRFIFVLDGLDKIEALSHLEKKFFDLCGAIKIFLQPNPTPGCAFLLVSRTNNAPVIREILSPHCHGSFRAYDRNEKKLISIPFEEIFEKRLKYLEREVGDIIRKRQYLVRKDVDWTNHLNNFKYFLWKGKSIPDKYYEELHEIFGENNRAQVQTIQCNYFEFLNEEMRNRYLLVESLSRAGRDFPPRPYMYILRGNGKLIRLLGNNIFDNYFIPNIFLFPFVSIFDDNIHVLPDNHMMLAGLRILQIVDAHFNRIKEMRKSEINIDPLCGEEIADALAKIFDYPDDIVIKLIEEFSEYELFFVGGVDLNSAPNSRYYTPIPMPKMKYIKESLIFDIAYLNLCSMRIPISSNLLEKIEPPFFKALRFTKSNLRSWITNKIINSISICRLIRFINEKEEQLFNDNIESLPRRLKMTFSKAKDSGGMFSFPKIQKKKILSQIVAITKFLSKDDIKYVETMIDRYFKVWAP